MDNKELSILCDALKVVSEHQKKQADLIKKMFFGLLIAVVVCVCSVCGSVLYIWHTSDGVEIIETTTVEQETTDNSSIINGNQFNDHSQNNN